MTGPTAVDAATVAALADAVGGDAGFLDELADAYLADAPAHLAAIADAVRAGSAAALVLPAHTLKSSSASLGALALSKICRELELEARDGSLDGAPERAAAAEVEFRRVEAAIEGLKRARWVAGMPTG